MREAFSFGIKMRENKEVLLFKDSFIPNVDVQNTFQRRRERYQFTVGLVVGLGVSCVVFLLLSSGAPILRTFVSVLKNTDCSKPENAAAELDREEAKINEWLSLPNSSKDFDRDQQSQWKQKTFQLDGQDIKLAAACTLNETDRFDCWPEEFGASQQGCQARGCCWNASTSTQGVPYCFYPQGYVSYVLSPVVPFRRGVKQGMSATLTRKTASPYPDDVLQLQIDVTFETADTVRFKIFDPHNQRYEVPLNLSKNDQPVEHTDYQVTLKTNPFGILIMRKSNGVTIFDSSTAAPLVFADQFLQFGTRLTSSNIYGLGEHRASLRLNTNWTKLVLWNRDINPSAGGNLYGSHPFFLNLEADGQAHGVFLLNSNAMEVALQPSKGNELGALTYHVLGGILDFYVFTGPTALNVVEQYVSLIGRPTMPPFWALGFHLCRWGYMNSTVLRQVIQRNRAADIPYDVQWSDIDYMHEHLDWTYDNTTFPDLPDIVDDLHRNDQRYIMIIDPGISSGQPAGSYPPFDQGVQMGVFIKNATGQILVGEVWPGPTAFPDFFHPSAEQYWYNQMKSYWDKIPFNGIWIDMNEPSNFVEGSTVGCTKGPLDNPPFTPPTINGGKLISKTVCPSAQQAISSHYNLHNLYGWSETKVTASSLTKLLGKRSLIVSRSSFASSGHYGSHWLGDNMSLWPDLYYSIPGILNFNMFGVAMVGADVCGFTGDTTRELCIRWMQLGAFYPFMRNHNNFGDKPQDPAVFDSVAVSYMRQALRTRYSLLPYMYTRFFVSHTTGTSLVRPLFALFPNTEDIDKQFMWGEELLISPVLEEGATTVNAYIPEGVWYDFYNGSRLKATPQQYNQLQAPLSTINVHIRGGSIIPCLPPAVNTNTARKMSFQLIAAPDVASSAQGQLFWDDGESLDPVESGNYSLVRFILNGTQLTTNVLRQNYPVTLDTVQVLGVNDRPANVTLNGKIINFYYNSEIQLLMIYETGIDLLQPFLLKWAFS